jgi:hypothetical protein
MILKEDKLNKKLKLLKIKKEKELEVEFNDYKIAKTKENNNALKKMRVEKEEKVLSKINIENVFSCNDLYKK